MLFLMALFLTMSSGCYSVRIAAPFDQEVSLANKGEILGVTEKKRNWYALWGLVPLGNHSTNQTIKEYGFSRVRIETKISFLDYVISIFTSPFTIVTNTTIIEGSQK